MDKDELIQYLKENLSIIITSGDFTNPNSRKVELKLDGEVISTAYFNVRQMREYEG